MIPFHPLTSLKESCSHLLIDDSVHLYLRNLTSNIFVKIITTKDRTIDPNIINMFDTNQLNNLLNPNKNTKYKFNNLFNIVSATSFSKNLISFEIDFTNSPQSAKVNFKYPLYDILNTIQNNTIFGIYLEDNEIRLFKQIYENYIIDIIDNLFKEPIKILKESNHYSKFYILATIKLILEETYLEKYNISFIFSLKSRIERYKDMLSNLNQYTSYNEFTNFDYIDTENSQKIDQEAYKNEIQIRQASEPNWLLLKGDKMGNRKKQVAVIKNDNIGHTLDKFGFLIEYDLEQYQNKIRKFNAGIIAQEYENNYQIWKNNQKWNKIFYWQNLVLYILENNGGGLWYDTRINKYCFRSKLNASTINVDNNELGNLLTRALREKITTHLNQNNRADLSNYAIEIVLVFKLKSLNKQTLNINEKADNVIKILLFENAIHTIDDDVFDINNNDIYFQQDDTDFLYTRNRFVPNQYLEKRYLNKKLRNTSKVEKTVTEDFIFHLTRENQELFDYIMNWLAYYFQYLQKTKTALVLLGEQEVTQGIFWNIIIQEIFSQQYCTTINDKEHGTDSVYSIAKDTLFFHIGDIIGVDTKFDDNTLALIIKEFLIKPSVITDANAVIDIHGQMIITAKNPAPYLKKVLSKCTVIEVNNIDTIIKNLHLEDESELEDMILNDLHNFTDKLLQYEVIIDKALTKIDTEARQILKSNKSSNIDSEDIDKKLDAFIQAIKDKEIDYFKKVKDGDNIIYEHLKNAFTKDEGYFINQYLFDCYNSIYANQPFKNKKQFMNKLKGKDDMFKQEVKIFKILDKKGKEKVLFQSYKTSKETGNKELYKIKDYKLASDIIIPNEATILSSQENITKFTFENNEDIDRCIERTKKYRAEKVKEKE
jgi:hypothetical protein